MAPEIFEALASAVVFSNEAAVLRRCRTRSGTSKRGWHGHPKVHLVIPAWACAGVTIEVIDVGYLWSFPFLFLFCICVFVCICVDSHSEYRSEEHTSELQS